MSPQVQEAINKEAKNKASFKYEDNGVLDGEAASKKSQSN